MRIKKKQKKEKKKAKVATAKSKKRKRPSKSGAVKYNRIALLIFKVHVLLAMTRNLDVVQHFTRVKQIHFYF